MRYRRFGKTNLRLSVLSLGTMRCLASPEVAAETVGAAIAAGVNHLETAQGYGESERYLGAALAQRPEARSQLYVTTKVSPMPERATMERAIAVSLERLGLDYIDCLAIHGLNTPEHLAWVTDLEGCMAAVRAAIAAGRVGHSLFVPNPAPEAIAPRPASTSGFYCASSLLEQPRSLKSSGRRFDRNSRNARRSASSAS